MGARVRAMVRTTLRIRCRWWRCARMEKAVAACRCCANSARPEGGLGLRFGLGLGRGLG